MFSNKRITKVLTDYADAKARQRFCYLACHLVRVSYVEVQLKPGYRKPAL